MKNINKKIMHAVLLIMVVMMSCVFLVSCDKEYAPESKYVFTTVYGKVYHNRDCSYIKDKANNELLCDTIKVCKIYGVKPCSKCQPNIANPTPWTTLNKTAMIATSAVSAVFLIVVFLYGLYKDNFEIMNIGISLPLIAVSFACIPWAYCWIPAVAVALLAILADITRVRSVKKAKQDLMPYIKQLKVIAEEYDSNSTLANSYCDTMTKNLIKNYRNEN